MCYTLDCLGDPPTTFTQIGVLTLVLVAGVVDFRSRRIPNWLSLTALVLGILWGFIDRGWEGASWAMAGAGIALLVYVPLFLLRAIGAGDGKLMAAVGAFLGPAHWFAVFVLTAVVSAILGLIAAMRRGRLRSTLQNFYALLVSLRLQTAPYESHPQLDVRNVQAIRMPHAVSIALATLAYLALLHLSSRH